MQKTGFLLTWLGSGYTHSRTVNAPLQKGAIKMHLSICGENIIIFSSGHNDYMISMFCTASGRLGHTIIEQLPS